MKRFSIFRWFLNLIQTLLCVQPDYHGTIRCQSSIHQGAIALLGAFKYLHFFQPNSSLLIIFQERDAPLVFRNPSSFSLFSAQA
jgi:hypothetical protein